MVLVLDRAPWHHSHDVQKMLAERDIIVIWYPVGHPHLNPVEEVWNILKGSVDRSIRYADIKSHLTVIFDRIKNGKGFDYDFVTFWKRNPPKGVTRPIIRTEGDMDPAIAVEKVNSNPPKKRSRRKKSIK